MLAELICLEYENKIRKSIDGNENNKALLIEFSKNSDSERYPSYELMIFGKYNCTGVYLRDKLLHPDEVSDWFCLSYHDSCWKQDGVEMFLWRAEKEIVCFRYIGNLSPFEIRTLSEEEISFLRDAKHARYDYSDPEIHESFMNS
jgi:hypothetical protein